MSLHIGYDHQCPDCSASYIPYDSDVSCPKCGHMESERFDFVPEAIESMKYNKLDGKYTPPAWLDGDISDHILLLLFWLFDAYEASDNINFELFASEWFPELDWQDQQYMCQYMVRLGCRIFEAL